MGVKLKFECFHFLEFSTFYRAIFLTMKHQIKKTNPQFDTVFAYKIEIQFKNFLYLRIKNLVFFASEAPLCTKFQNLMNLFD